MSTIHHHPSFANLTKTEFNTLVQHHIIPSIRDYCKELLRSCKDAEAGYTVSLTCNIPLSAGCCVRTCVCTTEFYFCIHC